MNGGMRLCTLRANIVNVSYSAIRQNFIDLTEAQCRTQTAG
jgi:hypothetical protein